MSAILGRSGAQKSEERTLLFVYRSPIEKGSWWNGRVIALFLSQGQIEAEVCEKGRCCKPALHGCPGKLSGDVNRLRKFFSSTFLTIEKGLDGTYSYVRVNGRLNGGMMSQADLLPMYPGYAIGSLISETNYKIPILDKKRRVLQVEVEQAAAESEALVNSISYKEAADPVQQKLNIIATFKSNQAMQRYEQVCDELATLCQSSAATFAPIEHTLPIDPSRSSMRVEDRSFPSERMQHLIFDKTVQGFASDRIFLQGRVEKFISQLFSQEMPASSIPAGAIEGVVDSIGSILQKEDRISLVGSFITLPRVIVMDPIKLRRNGVSEGLKRAAANYYVLTEAALGAVFLGLGKASSGRVGANPDAAASGQADINEDGRSFMSRLAMISFISQGAIPRTSKDAHDVNLWSVYSQWKETLLTDRGSGYPIGFRVRPLLDVLRENQIEFAVRTDSSAGKGDSGSSSS